MFMPIFDRALVTFLLEVTPILLFHRDSKLLHWVKNLELEMYKSASRAKKIRSVIRFIL